MTTVYQYQISNPFTTVANNILQPDPNSVFDQSVSEAFNQYSFIAQPTITVEQAIIVYCKAVHTANQAARDLVSDTIENAGYKQLLVVADQAVIQLEADLINVAQIHKQTILQNPLADDYNQQLADCHDLIAFVS